jgi:hypothetical protein
LYHAKAHLNYIQIDSLPFCKQDALPQGMEQCQKKRGCSKSTIIHNVTLTVLEDTRTQPSQSNRSTVLGKRSLSLACQFSAQIHPQYHNYLALNVAVARNYLVDDAFATHSNVHCAERALIDAEKEW